MATPKKMLGIHLSEAEHELAKRLAAMAGESMSVLFRQWLREQAKKQRLARA
ncbi:MAG: hypothetical protein U0174_23165 [Polyangiaceae bacterium]